VSAPTLVWSPNDFAATVAAAALHEPASVRPKAGFQPKSWAVRLNGQTISFRMVATRGWWYRGAHRQNGFRPSVDDIKAAIDMERAAEVRAKALEDCHYISVRFSGGGAGGAGGNR